MWVKIFKTFKKKFFFWWQFLITCPCGLWTYLSTRPHSDPTNILPSFSVRTNSSENVANIWQKWTLLRYFTEKNDTYHHQNPCLHTILKCSFLFYKKEWGRIKDVTNGHGPFKKLCSCSTGVLYNDNTVDQI